MPVRLRLQRFGRKKLPFYRMVAADARFKRDGRFLEIVSQICVEQQGYPLILEHFVVDSLCYVIPHPGRNI